MKPKTIYLALCLIGLLLPYSQFVPWVLQHGLNFRLFAAELFANRIGAFFGMDVVVSAVALLVFTRVESARVTFDTDGSCWSPCSRSASHSACRCFFICASGRWKRRWDEVCLVLRIFVGATSAINDSAGSHCFTVLFQTRCRSIRH